MKQTNDLKKIKMKSHENVEKHQKKILHEYTLIKQQLEK